MAQQDLISVKIPETDMQEIRAAIGVLKARLLPHLTVLSAQERSELPKMGDRTVAFVQKSLEYGQKNEALVPPYLDLDALKVDTEAVQALRELTQELNPITDALNDTMTLSGSEAYQGALVFYSSVKNAARAKAPSAGTIYEDLSSRFPGRGPAKKGSQANCPEASPLPGRHGSTPPLTWVGVSS